MTDIQAEFKVAVERARHGPKPCRSPSLVNLQRAYGLYKQATVGDVQIPRPDADHALEQAKYDLWAQHQGMSRVEAMRQYVAAINDER